MIVAVRRIVKVAPIALHGYRPPAPASNPVAAQFSARDDLFAHYPVLTLIHIVPGLLFMLLGPLQFGSTIRARYLRWHRWSGRVFVAFGFFFGIFLGVIEFWDAGDRRVQSSRRDYSLRIILFAGTIEGILVDPPARSSATSRMDDSRILNWIGGGYDPADYGDIFRH